MLKVSVIIVNYNGRHLLKSCLDSVCGQSFRDFEVILVDNGSRDGSAEFVKASFPEVKVISLRENIGFAGANAKGLSQAQGEYIALFNNDVEAGADCLGNLVTAMENDGGTGVCAAKMIVHGTKLLDSAGDGFGTNLKGFKRGEGRPSEMFPEAEYIFGACAGAALYRKKMLDEIGFLDEDFFLIHEDADLNLRAQLAGWKVLYVPAAVVYHRVGSSIGRMTDTAIYYTLRNCEFVRIKNIPLPLFIRCVPAFLVGTIADFLFFAVRHGKPGLYLKAKVDALRKAGSMFRKRREIMSLKKVGNSYLLGIMTPLLSKGFFLAKAKKFFCG